MTKLFIILIVYATLFSFASFAINRVRAKTTAEHVLWYLLVLGMPIIGSILVLLIANARIRRERGTKPESLDSRMRDAIIEARAVRSKQE